MSLPTYFSMFSGIGGFELGIGTRAQCVGYSEIDKYAIKVYERHFEHENFGDATRIDTHKLPDFDVLVGGFPCQAFSVAGKRRGFDEARGTLFFEIARVLADKRPRHLVLENVKGLLSHGGGKTFQVILGVLTDLGYRVEWQVLNSKDFGVPQNRERVFIVGHLRGKCTGEILPITRAVQADIKVAGSLDSETWRKRHEIIRRVHSTDGISPTIPTGTGGGVMNKIIVKRQPLRYLDRNQKNIEGDYAYTVDASQTSGIRIISNTKKGYETAEPGDGINIGAAGSKTRRGRVQSKAAQTINTSGDVGTLVDDRIRRLTPLECERLQGFPDNWTFEGVEPQTLASGLLAGKRVLISDTQRYKMAGNAVTVNVIDAVMEKLFTHGRTE